MSDLLGLLHTAEGASQGHIAMLLRSALALASSKKVAAFPQLLLTVIILAEIFYFYQLL
jgi:hypothetical protein